MLLKSTAARASLDPSCHGKKSTARVATKAAGTAAAERPAAIAELLAEPEPQSFSHYLIPDDVEDIDGNDGSNVLLATDYVSDIYAYLRSLEVSVEALAAAVLRR